MSLSRCSEKHSFGDDFLLAQGKKGAGKNVHLRREKNYIHFTTIIFIQKERLIVCLYFLVLFTKATDVPGKQHEPPQ